ncbi:hypothetical protein [Candidatus Methylocalor cossyra]|uniref:Cytochrome c domain-containing protein n=1 Tax=Candidatus Methylocalor cossyra TaxID=3108543 RepID=A0ABP1CD08_9GAMM
MATHPYFATLRIAVLAGNSLMAVPVQADIDPNQNPFCTLGQSQKIKQGLAIAPVPLNLENKDRKLVGLGSYIVNAQGGCNDCHTNPPYAPGGNPFRGEPEQINIAGYLAGGQSFGPFVSSNLTPCNNGEPEWTFEDFLRIMRTGVDLEDSEHPPGNTPLLQVMPWPVFGKMTSCDLRAIYEYLRAIPPQQCGH